MVRNPVPWAGLLALVAMFVIPFLPDWIFEGPRTVKHWPRRHVCGECGVGWTDGHVCEPEPVLPARARVGRVAPKPVLPVRARLGRRVAPKPALPAPARRGRLVGELRRLDR